MSAIQKESEFSFTTVGIVKKRRFPRAGRNSYRHYNRFLAHFQFDPTFMGLSESEKNNVLISLENYFFKYMNNSRMNGIRSSHLQKKRMFESIARNILAKCGKKEASESVLSDQPYHKDSEQLFFSEQTDAISAALVDERYSYVNLAASHRLPTDFQNELVFALGEILKSDVFCKETLGSRAYEPRVWEVNPPPLSPRSLRQ